MAMSAHLQLHLKRPAGLVSPGSHSPTPRCASRARIAPITHFSRLRTTGFNGARRARLCPRVVATAAAAAAAGGGEEESAEGKEAAAAAADEENSNFPAQFRDLIVDRGDPPNLFLYAAGFCVVVLMRDVILLEIANWGINFARVALYIAEGITIGLGKLTNATAGPLAFLMTVANWAIMAVDDTYTFIVDSAPVQPLLTALLLSLGVLSVGDAAVPRPRGSRSKLVGLAATLSLAALFELISMEAVVPSLLVITLFAKFVQKGDAVTVAMPATVALVTVSEPVIQAAALGIFLAISVWRASKEQEVDGGKEEVEASAGKRPSAVLLAITGAISVSLCARALYLRTVKWLLLRSA